MTKRYLACTLITLLAAAALPALGAEGRTPIWQPVTIGPGGEGKYIVTRDVSAVSGAPVIHVLGGTIAVDIDLNGFTLYGLDDDVIRAKGVDSLSIRNGTIMFGTGSGIYVEEARKVVIEDVKIEFVDQFGIFLGEVSNFAVRRSIVLETGPAILADGFLLDPSVPTQGVIEGCETRDSTDGIIVLNGSSVALRDNHVEGSQGMGLLLDSCGGCVAEGNTIQDVQAEGIGLFNSNQCRIDRNVIVLAQANGIFIDPGCDGNLVLSNAAGQCGLNGMQVDGTANHLERNTLNRNGTSLVPGANFGMLLTAPFNTYRGNTAHGNPGAGCPSALATTDFCDATGGGNNSAFAAIGGDNLMPTPL